MKKLAVLCDFDGTIAADDVGNRLFSKFADPELSATVVEQWKQGAISSRECLEKEASLARASRTELDRFISRRKLDPFFKDFVDFTKRRDIEVVIVSDGLDYYIEKMLIRNGLAHLEFFANLLQLVDENMHVKFPHYDLLDCRDCGNCKAYHVERYRAAGYFIAYVGNGLSDRCPSRCSDLVFAKGELLEYCRGNGVDYVEFQNFRDVERELIKRFVINGDAQEGEDVVGL
jgi:2,3-diketo-5-methylthio-1-phosphopentane phosphatase